MIYWNIFVLLLMFRVYICENYNNKSYKYYKVFHIEGPTSDVDEIIKYIVTLDKFAAYEVGINYVHVIFHPKFVRKFKDFGKNMNLNITEAVSDFSELLQKETKQSLRNGEYNMTGYYDIDDIIKYMASTQEKHAHWSQLVIGGESYQGRKIVGLRILTNVRLPNNKPKPVVFIEAGIHAREWISPASALYLIDYLLNNRHPNVTSLRDSFDWHIFPVLNPDGYHYSYTDDRLWRKSRSLSKFSKCIGVDLNRNWDYMFGTVGTTDNPCDYQIYAGTAAFSEVESRSMAAYISKLDNMLAYLSLHSFAKCILIPYSSTGAPFYNNTVIKKIALRAADYAFALNGETYAVGSSPKLFSASSGTSTDWVFSTKRPRIVLNMELKGSSFHWPAQRIPEMGEEVSTMIVGLFAEARKLGLYRPALPYT